MHFPFLNEIIVIFALSSVVLLVCHRIRLPTIVGFLLTGVLAGPHGFGLIEGIEEVEHLAEIGIVLLLFTIGLEMSLSTLLKSKRAVLLGGSLQVGLTVLASSFLASHAELTWQSALFIGFLVSLSSTAIVLKLMQDRAEIDSPQGRVILGILIFQDIVAIPMMLLTPVLAGAQSGGDSHPLRFLALLVGIVLVTVAGARWLIPQALRYVAQTQNRELFLVSIVTVCFAVAWLTSSMGLSLALGAFLAGLIVSESEYSHTAVSYTLPFRDIFSSFFFVSIGMLLDLGQLLEQPLLIGALTLGVLALKGAIAGTTTLVLGFPLRTAILAGLGLSQVGEFSFVLARGGIEHHLLSPQHYALFLAVSVLSMILTPLVMDFASRLAGTAERWPVPSRLKAGLAFHPKAPPPQLHDHLIIVGFGFNGQNVARATVSCGLPYVILEMQPDLVRQGRARGEPIYYGDATQAQVLLHVHLREARVLVIAISDPAASRLVVSMVRSLSPRVHIIVRTRYIHELKPLYDLGANTVIPEEYETSVEIFIRVLTEYLVPRVQIEQLVAQMRDDGYQMMRSLSLSERRSPEQVQVELPDFDLLTVTLNGGSFAAGKSIADLELRKQYGVTLLLVRRSDQVLLNPDPKLQLEVGDIVTLIGTLEQVARVAPLFELSEEEAIGGLSFRSSHPAGQNS